jgi:hypothetical protein
MTLLPVQHLSSRDLRLLGNNLSAEVRRDRQPSPPVARRATPAEAISRTHSNPSFGPEPVVTG